MSEPQDSTEQFREMWRRSEARRKRRNVRLAWVGGIMLGLLLTMLVVAAKGVTIP